MPRYLTDDWKPVNTESPYEWARDSARQGQVFLCRMFRRYGKLIFSTESDGTAHIFPEESVQLQIKRFGRGENYDPAAVAKRVSEAERARFAQFIESSKKPEKIDWSQPDGYHGKTGADITIPIFRALAGTAKMRIVASRPNYGAVRDFGPETPLEYTMDIFGKSVTPVENQYIPAPFYGLTASLAEFQRLQSEAIAKWEPGVFADALDAYPARRFMRSRKKFFREMFGIYADLDPQILEAKIFI
jgi:alpha-galactosidase/6-phospho-beta-glucosidase family protein